MKKYYKVFTVGLKNRFECVGTHTNKKEAYRQGKDLVDSYITKTIQDDANNQGRVICEFKAGEKFEL